MRDARPAPPAPFAAALGGLVALAVALGIGRFVYTPILPSMIEGLGLSKSTAGLIASANFAGYLAGALFAAGRVPGSRRAWLLGALLASALSTGAMGCTGAVPAFLALRFVGGVASALALILASALVLEALAEADRPGLSSVLFAGVGVGIALSAAIVAALLAGQAGWRAPWLASGALSLLGVLAVAALVPSDRPAPSSRPGGDTARTGTALVRLVAAYGLFGFGYVITATFIVAMVRADATLRPFEPVVWVAFGLAAAPSVAAWGRVAARLGLPRAYAAACLVEAGGVLASVAWRGPAGVLVAAVLVGGTFMGLTALGLVRARGLARGDARRLIALMTSAFGLGQIVGPSFAGLLYDRLGSLTVPSLTAAVALVLAAVLAWV
ncbi:MAG: YbfB/YjiJ family MFS transporter [Acetobacteraceae bacterium]|nr:YbfB/YjiJ family MFS transporter [Acetobacteraceae bacterium]